MDGYGRAVLLVAAFTSVATLGNDAAAWALGDPVPRASSAGSNTSVVVSEAARAEWRCEDGTPVLYVVGTVTVKNEGTSEQADWNLLLETAQPLSELRQAKTTRVDIHLNADQLTHDQIEELRGVLAGSRGNCQAVLRLHIPQRSESVIPLGSEWTVAPTDELLTRLERLFGERVATFA